MIQGLVLSSALVCYCAATAIATDDNRAPEHYDLSMATAGQLSDVFSEVELTPLRYDSLTFLYNDDQIITPEAIIVRDMKSDIVVFTPDGSFVARSLEKKGDENASYSTIFQSGWNPYTRQIEVCTPGNMICFDPHLNLVSSIVMPNYTDSVHDHRHMYASTFNVSDSLRLIRPILPHTYFLTEPSCSKIIGEFSYGDEVIVPMNFQPLEFFRMPDNKILFTPKQAMTNAVYRFEPSTGSLNREITFHTGDNGIRAEHIDSLSNSNDQMKLREYLISCDKEMLMSVLPASDWIITLTKHGNNLRDSRHTFIDRTTGKLVALDIYDGETRQSPLFTSVADGYAYAIQKKSEIMSMPGILLDKAASAYELTDGLSDDTFILLRYRFR